MTTAHADPHMGEPWTARDVGKGSYLLFDSDGTMIGICDARYLNLVRAAPDMLHALMAALVPAGDTPAQVRAEMRAAVRKATGRGEATP